MTNPPDECRAVREAWVDAQIESYALGRGAKHGQYQHPYVLGLWRAWSTAWQARPEPDAEDPVRALGLAVIKGLGVVSPGYSDTVRLDDVFVMKDIFDAAVAAQREQQEALEHNREPKEPEQ